MPDRLGILFLGDIIGRPGRHAISTHLQTLVQKYAPSLVVANAENAAGGIGITEKVGQELLSHIDVLTSGNHVWDKREALEYLDKQPRLLRPANYPHPNPGKGVYMYKDAQNRKVAIMNLQGRVFMEPIDCPFRVADECIEELSCETQIILVDFHAEATSEKQALGWYLDGRVTAVVGTHTHVPTADARILTGGTAYITDVGMVGGYNSVIGIQKDQAMARFLTSRPQRFEPAKAGIALQAVCIEVDPQTGKALSITQEILTEGNDGA